MLNAFVKLIISSITPVIQPYNNFFSFLDLPKYSHHPGENHVDYGASEDAHHGIFQREMQEHGGTDSHKIRHSVRRG